jgi:hypothetical protein
MSFHLGKKGATPEKSAEIVPIYVRRSALPLVTKRCIKSGWKVLIT